MRGAMCYGRYPMLTHPLTSLKETNNNNNSSYRNRWDLLVVTYKAGPTLTL